MNQIIPKINGKSIVSEGQFVLPKMLLVQPIFPDVYRVFSERLAKIGDYELVVDPLYAQLLYVKDETLSKEAYQLKIEQDRIRVTASGEHGFSNALVSLYQMLAEGKGTVDCEELTDEPKYERRGFMLDCCRHFFPVDVIKKLLEQCALLKINHFHWHLSEDQGYRIESKRFPKLNEISSYRKLAETDPLVKRGLAKVGDTYGGYYTQEEIKDILAFCKERMMDVFPEIDLPGHSVAALAAYPEYSCSGEPGEVEGHFGIFERIYCAGKEETYTFLNELIDEVSSLFPSPYFHLGGDEVPKGAWKKCPDCNRVMKEQGFTDYEELQAYFTERLIRHLREIGKTPIVWNEASASGKLDESAILQYWYEGDGENYTVDEIRKGRKFILSNVKSFYCDYSYEAVPVISSLMYEPQIQGQPIPAENIWGVEAPMWCEEIAFGEEIEKMINPRILAVAENGWTRERDFEEFSVRLKAYQDCKALNFLKQLEPGEKKGVNYLED